MPRFEKTLQVSAPAERAWEVIGDLTLMGRLAGATEVKGRGADTGVHAPGWGRPARADNELLTRAAFVQLPIEDGPLPVKNSQGKFAVQPAGDDSEIVWKAEFEPIDPSQSKR